MSHVLGKLKNCWKSWTIWFNGVVTAIMMGLPALKDQLPDLQPYIESSLYKHLMVAAIVGNILLRFKTSKPLEAK